MRRVNWLLSILCLIATCSLRADACLTKTAQDHSEDGSSGPGLKSAIKRSFPISVTNTSTPDLTVVGAGWRDAGNLIVQNPKSRFAIFMWKQDAAGNDIALIDSSDLDVPGPWRESVESRFWSGSWSKDVSAFGWSPNGEEMIVATGDVFNESGVYWLDLKSKASKQLGAGELTKIDWAGRKVFVGKEGIALPMAKIRGSN